MFDKLKRKIAHYLIRKKYLRINNLEFLFNNIIKESKTVLILIQESNKNFENSLSFLNYLIENDKNITIFCTTLQKESILVKSNCNFIFYTSEQITKFYLPDKKLVKELRDKEYDLVVDLSFTENTFLSAVSNIINAKIRMGFERGKSDLYYNFLINSKNNENVPDFEHFLSTIKMF